MAIRSKFDPAPDGFDAATYRKGASAKPGVRPVAAPRPAEPAPRRLVIVGSGIAAHTAAQEARRLDPKATILLVGAESAFYNRLNLTRLLAGELERSALFDFGADWAKAQRVEARYGVAVNGIDPVARVLKLADGSRLDYDACILAHGASPSLPAFWREGMGGLVALRRLEDFDTVRRRLRPGEAVAVVGGGVLGVEAAFALATQGARVVLIELMDRLMPRQLDAEAAEMLRARAEAAGIRVLLGQGVRELRGAEEVERLILADGSELAVHQVLVSAGMEPNTAWLRAAGLACGRGVTVDDRMATSAPDVYACGDVAEWRGRVCGLWTHAQEQAQVAAASALGRPAAYAGTLPVTILKCAGVDCVSIGEIPVEGPGVDARTLSGEGSYRRLYLRHGLPVGAILYGDAGELGEWRKLVEDGLALEFRQRRLLPLEALVAS
jgi:nitrite reductase (NADH) large subunit